jgi:Tfp pilus assembly protein PilN
MKNQRITLEFAPRPRRLSARVMGALVLSCLLLASSVAAVVLQLSQTAAREAAQRAASKTGSAAASKPAKPAKADPRELARHQFLKQVVRSLETPWADLLASLETAPTDVALLAIEPSVSKRVVSLTAETADPEAMLNYLQALQSDPHFSNVTLVSHQIQLQAPGTPLRFKLQASWGAAP